VQKKGLASFSNARHTEKHVKWWCIVDDDDLVKESHRRLTDFIKTWHPIAAQNSEAPKTCLECHDSSHELAVRGCALLKDGDAFGLRGDYLVPWTIRAYLVDLMFEKEDIISYYVNQVNELTLHEFFEMNGPDAKDNFDKLYRAFRQEKDRVLKSVTEFLAWLKVPGCLWLCFACDLGLGCLCII
jgi:hypothetical protein